MPRSAHVRLLRLLALPVLVAFAACDNPVRDDDHHEEVSGLELYADAALTQELASTHGQGASMHWHGSLPHIHPGEELTVYARFVTGDGHSIPLGGEYTVRADLANEAQDGVTGAAGIVGIENHSNHVDLTGQDEGVTHIVFQLWHGSHADWRSAAIEVEVEDH